MADIEIALGGTGRKVQFWLTLDPLEQPDKFLLHHFDNGLCFEAEILWVLLHTLQAGDVAIDVGANIGFFTLIMSQLVGPTGKVVACEPGANNLPSLRHHLERNGIHNVSIEERPIWAKEGPIDFYLNADDRSSNALFDPAQFEYNVKARAMPQKVRLNATTLDEVCADLPEIKIIKIDTEGAEQRVLEGAANILRMRQALFVIAELNPLGLPQTGCSAETMRDFMRQFGYEMFFIHQTDLLPTLVPPTTKVSYVNGIQIRNVLFATMNDVAAAWPEAMG